MLNSKFTGTGVALVTPFRNDGSIDFKSLEQHVNRVIEEGVNYLVALGTTAETPVLTKDEKATIVAFIKEINDERVPLVVGLGGNNTSALIDSIGNMDFKGIDAILSVAPYYNKPSQEGIYLHFKEIAVTSPVPVILYNVPGRTSSNINADTTVRLAENFKNQIIAIKEASGDFSQIMKIIKNKPKDFLVLSGEDALSFPMITLGGKGVISVIANAYPSEYSEMIKLALDHKIEEARELHYKLLPVIDAMFAEGNPAGVKAFLNARKYMDNNLRLPLIPASNSLMKEIQEIVKKFDH